MDSDWVNKDVYTTVAKKNVMLRFIHDLQLVREVTNCNVVIRPSIDEFIEACVERSIY